MINKLNQRTYLTLDQCSNFSLLRSHLAANVFIALFILLQYVITIRCV